MTPTTEAGPRVLWQAAAEVLALRTDAQRDGNGRWPRPLQHATTAVVQWWEQNQKVLHKDRVGALATFLGSAADKHPAFSGSLSQRRELATQLIVGLHNSRPADRSSAGDRTGIREDYREQRDLVGGRYVSRLLGTDGHPEHGTVSGADWYSCGCIACRTALAETSEDRNEWVKQWRERNKEHLVTRGGTQVSTLLGPASEGFEEDHGLSGYQNYHCRCKDKCGAANNELNAKYRQRYSPAGKTARDVLTEVWPVVPGRGDVTELAGEIAAVWSDVRRGDADEQLAAIRRVLDNHRVWGSQPADERANVADELTGQLRAPRRYSANGPYTGGDE